MNRTDAAGQLFQLDRAACITLITTQRVGRLVTADIASPVIVVNYTICGGDIVVRCDQGSSAAATAGTAVAFEIDVLDERTRSGWSVIVRGVARDVTATHGTGESVDVVTWAPGPKSRWIAIEITDVTGRLLRGDPGVSRVDPRAYL
jgi:hypothetical protein